MLIVGIILVLVGVGLFVWRHFTQKRIYELRSMEHRKAGEITEIAGEIAAELGPGSYEAVGEIVGDILCESPLQSPLAGRPCVYYSMKVTREYEEEYWDKDANGNRVRKTRRGSETINSQTEGRVFQIDDGTGRLDVDPTHATFDGLAQSMSRFDPHGNVGAQLKIGGWTMAIGGLTSHQGRRTLGYRYTEHVLEPGKRLTAMGKINDTMGHLAMRKSDDQKLTLSTRSREELVASARKKAKLLMIFGGICAVGGVVLAVIGAIGG